MSGSRMHDAAALLQRDVLAKDSRNHTIEKGMLELGAGKAGALSCRGDRVKVKARFPYDATQKFLGYNIGISVLSRRKHISMLRMKGQRHACRQGPWRGRPDQRVNAPVLIRSAICRFQQWIAHPD